MIGKIITYLLGFFKSGQGRSQKLKRNTAWSVIIKIGQMLIGLFKVPVMLLYLNQEVYGVWLTIGSMILWTQYFDFGLGTGLRYKFAEALALKDKERGKILVSTAYISMGVIMMIFFIVLFIVIKLLDWNNILNTTMVSNYELQKTVIVVLGAFLLQIVCALISTLLFADQRSAIAEIFKPIANVVSLVGIFLLSIFDSSNSIFLAASVMSLPYVILLLCANVYFFSKDYRDYYPQVRCFKSSALKDIYSMGLKFFLGQFASLVVFSSASIIITQLLGPSQVTVYNSAYLYFSMAILLNSMAITPSFSAMTDAYVKKEFDWIKTCMKKLRQVSALLSVMVILMLLFSQFAFKIWLGNKIIIPVGVSIILAINTILNINIESYTTFLGGVGKLNIFMILACFKIVFYIPVSIAFIKMWGLIGLVVAIIIINTIPNYIFTIRQYHLIINNKAKGIWNK